MAITAGRLILAQARTNRLHNIFIPVLEEHKIRHGTWVGEYVIWENNSWGQVLSSDEVGFSEHLERFEFEPNLEYNIGNSVFV